MASGFGFGLQDLPLLTPLRTRSISAENPTGARGKGGMAIPRANDLDVPHAAAALDLGQRWKVRPFLKPRAGQTVTLMDVDGPGVIQHIWIATEPTWRGNGRACILRFYWDNEAQPSVEVPLTDFFAVGHEMYAPINSLAVVVTPAAAANCYWPMPFRKHARVTFTNELDRDLELLAFQITYAECEVPPEAGYFHAQWRRAVTERTNPDYVIVDGLHGRGRYVGTFLAWSQLSEGWFGEGEIKFYMDGDKEFPTICGTGTEDYFCSSYCFPESYATLYAGAIKHRIDNGPPKWSLYRWHLMDPIAFDRDLRVTIQALGWWPNKRYQPLQEDIASVAYWYQGEPHAVFPAFPPLRDRWSR
jgi:hypothetical protein